MNRFFLQVLQERAFHYFVHVIVSMFSIGHDIHVILLYRYAYFDGLGHCDELEM